MTKPVRLQLSCAKGFSLQALSIATNGLPAVNVARPSRLGNKYRVGVHGDAAECVRLYRENIEAAASMHALGKAVVDTMLARIRGKNLACWCKVDPCHASVLLELANAP